MKAFFKVVFFLAASSPFAVKAQTTNYQVHSLFVMNIAKYSTWPAASGEFHIVVFGKSKVYEELTKQSGGKTIGGMSVKVVQIDDVADLTDAQIVFIADGKSSALDDIVKATNGKSVMIIAEREGLYKKGAGFSFVIMDNNTMRYDINNTDLEKRQIKISKALSALAKTII
jgi:hypothetical protein